MVGEDNVLDAFEYGMMLQLEYFMQSNNSIYVYLKKVSLSFILIIWRTTGFPINYVF